MNRPHALRTVRALLGSVVVSVALSLVGLYLVRRSVPQEILRETNDIVGNYLQTLGTIYAVLLAFVVFVVWNQFNDARSFVEREANELIDLFRTSKGLPAPTRDQVHARLAHYVDVVLEKEWEAMARGNEPVFEEAAAILDDVWEALEGVEPKTESQGMVQGEILARFNELSDVRTNRLTSGRLKIPLALKILLYTGAITTIGMTYLFAVDRWPFHALMTGAMAGALSHVLHVIHDLDDCFAGDWQVPRSAFERVREYMGKSRVREKAA
ncbi:MAG: DUF4239 domain-containing protein [Deltaproteobacteria bacterium]|nr:DUF4239 domain-containing protein [Deltaproteobacteria bacterium]